MKALLIEDNAGDVRLIRLALQEAKAGVELDVAQDGVEAIELLRARRWNPGLELPGFILLDLNLPRKHGLEVLSEIKRDPFLRNIPVIVLTSSNAMKDICRAYDMQATAYFAKPMSSFDDLVSVIVRFMKSAERPVDCPGVPLAAPPSGSPLEPSRAGPSLLTLGDPSKERKLAGIVEASVDPIISATLDGTITTWNPAAEGLYGYTEREAVGRSLHLIAPEEEFGRLDAALETLRRGGKVEPFETDRIDRRGRTLTVSTSLSPLRDERGEMAGVVLMSRDVTGHKHVEARFHLAVERSPSAVVMVDEAGAIILVNSQTERLFGYRREELIGRPIELLVPDRFRDQHPEHRAAFMARPEARAMGAGRDLTGLRKDGTEFPIEIGLQPVSTPAGTIVLSAIVDITERKLADERFRLAVESSPSAMIMADAAGTVLLVNAETERLFGYPREELIGRSIEMLVPDRFRTHHPYLRAKFFDKPEFRAMGAGRDLYGLRKDGVEVPIEIGLTPIQTPSGTLVLSAIVDITERKQAEERFRMAVESSPSAMVMVDDKGVIVMVNKETERVFGYERAELIGESIEKLVPRRFREQHPRLRESFMSNPRVRAMGAVRDLRGLRKDGSEVSIELGLNPIKTARGTFVLSAIVDITQRKQAEERLSNQARELARSNAELEQFANAASHDLQEPLRMVASYTKLLARRYAGKLDEEAVSYINFAADGAVRMQGLIEALLAYSRVGSQGGELQPVKSGDALDHAVANLALSIEESGAEIVRGVLPTVLADQSQLVGLFQNLVSNALKFRGAKPPRVEITAVLEQSGWVFTVADNGIGIDPRYFNRIFDIFQRLHTRDQYPGTGIGLAICKRIVERLGGRIWVESKPGEGARFRFMLAAPAAQAGIGVAGSGAS